MFFSRAEALLPGPLFMPLKPSLSENPLHRNCRVREGIF
jgi:hypothetical protein